MMQNVSSHAPATAAPNDHDPYAALRLPTFRSYTIGYTLSILATQILATTVQWDLYQRTRSPALVSILALCSALPVMVFSLPAGQLADRMSRKSILLCAQLALVGVPLLLAQLNSRQDELGGPHQTIVFALMALNSIALTFARPARSSLVANLVPPPMFPNAFAWISSLFEMASWVGPALAGWLLLFHVEMAYYVVAGCLGVAWLLTLWLPEVSPPARSASPSGQSLLAGLRFVFANKPLLAAMMLDMIAVLFAGATYLLPMFAELLQVGPVGYGWLRAAPAGGAFAMAIWQAHRAHYDKMGKALLVSVVVFSLATIGFGLSSSFWLSLVLLVVLGAADNVSVVIRHSLVQSLTPDAMRGRVNAVNQVFITASNDLGGVESGLTAAWLGPVVSVVGGGVISILSVFGVAWLWPEIIALGSLANLRQSMQDRSQSADPSDSAEN